MTKIINFEIEDAEILEESSDSQFATAKIRAFSSDENRHNLYCSENVLQRTASTIYNKPILYSIDKRLDDFYTHVEPEDSLIAGFVVPESAEFERIDDGRLSLNVFAKIWKRYAPKVVQLFKRDSNRKSVSVEMELFETEPMANGLDNMLDFAYAGITLLGDYITEASPGANAMLISFSEENEKFQEAYNLEFGKYDDVDFTIPKSVKKNAQVGLDINGGGATSVHRANARYLLKNDRIEPERVRQIHKILSSIANKNDDINENNPNYSKWMMHGGVSGFQWIKNMADKLDELDKNNISYFDNNIVTFPYNSLKDANPAIRGIDPPVSLSQANAIAKQADAIGVDKEKNDWAIAISSFKKTHKVEDGKWVKKDKMAVDNLEEEEVNMTDEEKLEKFSLEVENILKDIKIPDEEVVSLKEQSKNFSLDNIDDWKKLVDAKILAFAEEEETPEEEKEETGEEENMSFSFDFSEAYSLFSEDFEYYGDAGKEFCMEPDKANFAKMAYYMYKNMSAMKEKMAKMEEDSKAYMAENEELKKFKAEKEQEQFNFAVDATIKEIEEKKIVSDENAENLREKAKEFSLETIDGWKNLAKSIAFDFPSKETNSEDEVKVKKYGLPFLSENRLAVNNSPWERKQ